MMVECKQVREEFSAFLDDELDIETKATVEEHLAHCANCLRELGGFKQVSDLYTALEPVRAPDTFEAELRKRLRPKPLAFLRTKRFVHWQLLPLTAAATAVIAVGGIFMLQQVKTAEQLRLTNVETTANANESLLAKAEPNGSENAVLPKAAALKEAKTSLSKEKILFEAVSTAAAPEARQSLPIASKAAAVPEKADAQRSTPNRRVLGGRPFVLSNNIWREQPYLGEESTVILRNSATYNKLAEQYTEILDIAELGPKVLFRINRTWYLLQPPPVE